MGGPDLVALAGRRGQAALEDARRSLQICNACRYCESYCAVFPAMTLRREFDEGDLIYLANLCHGCRDCYYACQYAPPHEFAINIPQVMSEVRLETYAVVAPVTRRLIDKPHVVTAFVIALMTTLAEFCRHWLGGDPDGRGFYAVVGRDAMIAFGLTAAGLALAGLGVGLVRYSVMTRSKIPTRLSLRTWFTAARWAITLRFLGGGGVGCNDTDERFSRKRRIYHHLLAGGFIACFAATSMGAIYDHVLGWSAPYPWISAPGLLGTVGGIAMIVGGAGLLWLKRVEDSLVTTPGMVGLDVSFLLLLIAVAATGIALRLAHDTKLLTAVVVVHLGSVAALFLTMPLGKFMHAGFRFLSLVRHAAEQDGDKLR